MTQEEKKQPLVPPVLPPPPEQPEFFPGFTKELQKLGVEQYKSHSKLVEAEKAVAGLEQRFRFTPGPFPFPRPGERVFPILPLLFFRLTDVKAYEQQREQAQQEFDIALQGFKSVEWKQSIMVTLPNYLSIPDYKIQSAEDVLQFIPLDTMTDADLVWLNNTYDRLKHLSNVLPEGFDGDAIDAQTKILNEVLTSPKLELRAVHNLTVEEIAKSFMFGVAELPEGMTEEDIRSMLSVMDLQDEEMDSAKDWLDARAKEWALESDRLNLIRSGMVLAEAPELTPLEFGKLLLTQPMMATVELLDKYWNLQARPMVAHSIIAFHKFYKTSEETHAAEIERQFNYFRSMGEDSWSAYAMAFNAWEGPWWMKLQAEAAFDPLTYIGLGFGTSVAKTLGTGLTKVGLRGVGTRIGPWVGAIENGYVAGADAVFKGGMQVVLSPIKGAFWLTGAGYQIPRTFTQMSRNFARQSYMKFSSALQRTFPAVRNLKGLTAKDAIDVGTNAIDQAIARPTEGWDAAVRAGAPMLEFGYIDDAAAIKMAKGIVKDVTFDTPDLAHLNSEVLNMFSGQGERITAGKIIADLGQEATEDMITKLSAKLVAFKQGVADSAKATLKGDSATNVLMSMFNRLESTRRANLLSPLTKYMNQAGRSASWHGRVADRILYSSLLVSMERRLVMPVARWNLLFANFGPFNFLENMQRSFLGGAEIMYPKSYSGVAETNRLFRGLANAPYELQLFERGEARLAQSIIDPKTGRSAVFKGGKIPFITKGVTIPERVPILGGKRLGMKINIAGKDYPLASFQDGYDMWGDFNSKQVAYDYQVHYMKSLAEIDPDSMRLLQETIDNNKAILDSVNAINPNDARDIERVILQDATQGPDAVRAHADIDVLEFERRQVAKELHKSMDKMTDVRAGTKTDIVDEVLDGSIFKDIDGRMAVHAEAERDMSLISLKNQMDVLTNEADAFLANPPRNLDEFLGDMQNISSLVEGTGERLHDYRKLTELRKAKLSPGEMDDFEVGSAKLLAEFMETSEEQLTKIMNQMVDNASAAGLNENQLAHLTDLDAVSRLELENILATRNKIADIESIIPKTPKKARTDRFWTQQRAQKATIWDEFDVNARKFKSLRLRSSRNFLNSVDKPAYIPEFVPEVTTELTPNHLAYLFGATGDDLYRGLTRVQHHATIRPKEDFVLHAMEQADAYAATLGKTAADIGFTDDAIGEVYDQLWHNLGVEPSILTPDSPTMMQMEEIRQELTRLHAANKIPESDVVKWRDYINSVADDVEGLPMYQPTVPAADIGLTEFPLRHGELERLEENVISVMKAENLTRKQAENRIFGPFRQEGKPIVRYDAEAVEELKDRLTVAASDVDVTTPSGVSDVTLQTEIERWFQSSNNESLQLIGKAASGSPKYLAEIRAILKEKYPSGFIRIFRGSGKAKNLALDREFTNVTSSRGTALDFEDTWQLPQPGPGLKAAKEFVEGVRPSVDNVLVRVDDIVSIAAVEESELIIPAAVLRERIANPLKPPKVAENVWFNNKEKAMTKARDKHALSYPTYDDANILDEGMRSVMPFWNYELFRWRWIPRTAMRTPGAMTGVARYMNYTDQGYLPVPGTDLQINILRGSVWMGGLRSMYLRDFPEYYDAMPGMEFIDYIARMGFFPGIHVMLPIVAFGAVTGKPEWGQLAPAWVRTGLSGLRTLSPEHIGAVLEHIYPDRFRDYMTMLTLAEEGHDADEIWRKKQTGEKITPEEEKLWLDATNRVDGVKGILMQQTGIFRIRPSEFTEIRKEMRLAIEEATGVPVAVQEQIDRQYPVTGKRFSDYYNLDVLQQKLLYEWETYRRWQGVTTPLYPSSWQMLDVKTRDYYEDVEKVYEDARRIGIYEDGELIRPSIEEANRQWVDGEIGPDQWMGLRSDIVGGLSEAVRILGESPAYKDVPKTFEERVKLLEERGIPTPTQTPDQELLYYYYELRPEYKWNWESQRMERDFDTYYAYIDILLESLGDSHRERMLQRIQSEWTPMEKLYWQVSREFMRPYRNLRSIVLNEYDPEQVQQIRRYEVAPAAERKEIQEIIGPDGDKLISGYQRKLREARQRLRILDPEMDAWLNFFGTTTSLLSTEAKKRYEELRKKYLVKEMIK